MPRLALLAFMAVLALALAACGEDQADADGTGTAPGAGGAPGARPPEGRATAGDESVALGLGTYCWGTAAGPGLCVDAIGVVTVEAELEVDEGDSVAVVGPLANAQVRDVTVEAWPRPSEPVERGAYGAAWSPDGSATTLTFAGGGFVADLPPGEYLVSLFATFPEGDASYGLLLTVR